MWIVRSMVLLGMAFLSQVSPAPGDKFFMSEGVRIRYIDQGSGKPVILLHGNFSWIEDSWVQSGVVNALVKRYRVVALDFRGFGKSDKPHDPSAYGRRIADDVVALMDHLGIDKAHLVGWSMGARVASWLIVNRPEHFSSATLGGSTYFVDSPAQREAFEAQARELAGGLTPEFIRRRDPALTQAQAVEFVAAHASMEDPAAEAAILRSQIGLAISEQALGATRVPVLHVIGSLDVTRMPASRRLKEKVLPSVEFAVVEEATHVGPASLLGRKEFVEAIQRFLARNSDRH